MSLVLVSYDEVLIFMTVSPTVAQWYVSRRQRTDAVAFPAAYDRIPDATIALHKAKRRKKAGRLRSYANGSSRHRAPLKPGQVVTAQHVLTGRWDQWATILESRDNGRSYHVRIDGHTYGTGGSSAQTASQAKQT